MVSGTIIQGVLDGELAGVWQTKLIKREISHFWCVNVCCKITFSLCWLSATKGGRGCACGWVFRLSELN
jgi:hypothetical protein